MIETRIAGIPCLIDVTHFERVRGSNQADSDWDYTGYSECEWDVLDRRGRPAPWISCKLTDKDRERIECEIEEEMK